MTQILIQSAAPDLDQSLEYYSKLQFELYAKDDEIAIVGDGKYMIYLDGTNACRSGIRIYTDERDEQTILSPGGVRVMVKSLDKLPELSLAPAGHKSLCGNNYGIGIESVNFSQSVEFWKDWGFKITYGNPETDGFVGMSHSNEIGLSVFKIGSCPHSFWNPSLTFFNGKEGNPKIIEKLREMNFPLSEEITLFNPNGIVDNVILKDPGGIGFFLFNDG